MRTVVIRLPMDTPEPTHRDDLIVKRLECVQSELLRVSQSRGLAEGLRWVLEGLDGSTIAELEVEA